MRCLKRWEWSKTPIINKIDLANEIYVINVGGYIGSSTQSEIEYAYSLGKSVHFFEEFKHG